MTSNAKPKTARRNKPKTLPKPVVDMLAPGATLSLDEVAEFAGCSTQQVRRLMKNDKDFPAPVYFSATPRFLVSELLNWVRIQADKRPSARRAAAAAETETAA